MFICYYRTYHDYIADQGTAYKKPELAIAFNSGMSQEETASWKETVDALVKNGVPTVFTVIFYFSCMFTHHSFLLGVSIFRHLIKKRPTPKRTSYVLRVLTWTHTLNSDLYATLGEA